jgi:hypothetical protein
MFILYHKEEMQVQCTNAVNLLLLLHHSNPPPQTHPRIDNDRWHMLYFK